MTVPVYDRIDDTEIAIGKPVTHSLVERLRNNLLAIFGIDIDDTTVTIQFPDGDLDAVLHSDSDSDPNIGTVTSGNIVSLLFTSPAIQIAKVNGLGLVLSETAMLHVSADVNPELSCLTLSEFSTRVAYSLGSPTTVSVVGRWQRDTSAPPTDVTASVPVDGAYHDIVLLTHLEKIELKFTETGGYVEGIMRCTINSNGSPVPADVTYSWAGSAETRGYKARAST